MKLNDISKKVTSKVLNKNLYDMFKEQIDLENFTLEQLNNARNKLRTDMSQIETNESFDSVNNEDYNKKKLYLDIINSEIQERSEIEEKAVSKSQQRAAGIALSAKRGEMPKSQLKGASKEMMKMSTKELEKYAGTKHKGLPKKKTDESLMAERSTGDYSAKKARAGNDIGKPGKAFSKIARSSGEKYGSKKRGERVAGAVLKKLRANESFIFETEEDRAEIVIAAKDMVERLTSWMQDTAEMESESMLALADDIRNELGIEQSEQFTNTVKPALETLYSSMEETRKSLISGLGILTGETEPEEIMGVDDDQDRLSDDDMGSDVGDIDLDDFGTSAPASGGRDTEGREKRESVRYDKQAIIERSRWLGSVLSSKKK